MNKQGKPLFSVKNVSRVYQMGEHKLFALNNVSLDIWRGEFLVVTGHSGSGKSTLLNLLGGMDRPTSGNIIFENLDLSLVSNSKLTLYRRNEIGFVFQFFNLLPTLTALENIEVVTEIATDPLQPLEALKLVEMEEYADHFPSQMSGGQQQRVAIARALASTPKVLFCDEPTGSLDSTSSKKVLKLLVDLCHRLHKNVVMITHNPELTKVGDRVIKIKDGKIDDVIVQKSPVAVDDLAW